MLWCAGISHRTGVDGHTCFNQHASEKETFMYDVTITNNYIHAFTVDNGNQAFAPGQTYQFPHWGNHLIHVPGMGTST
jgi:hypothetical protein